jgi:hypothetical protein
MSGCDHTCSAAAEFKEGEHLGHVRFTREVEPAVNKVQPARDQAQASRDWSDLESRRCELANLASSKLAIEPHVTLAQDPNDPLASLLGQLNRRYRQSSIYPPTSSNPQSVINPSDSAAQAEGR